MRVSMRPLARNRWNARQQRQQSARRSSAAEGDTRDVGGEVRRKTVTSSSQQGPESQGIIKLTHTLGPGMGKHRGSTLGKNQRDPSRGQSASHVPLSFAPVPVSPVHGELTFAELRQGWSRR
jgi:hypothetical protein